MNTALALVNQFYEVSLNQKDAEGLGRFLAEDFPFMGPMTRTKGKDAYVQLNAGFLPRRVSWRMLQFERDDEVCSIYEIELQTPTGGRIINPMADWVRVQGGKMVEQRIYYDAREFEKAFAPRA